jgi:hypothetical protein
MNSIRNTRRKGSAAVEMALIFLPLTMAVLSTFELGRAMWIYHTLTSAIKTGARTASFYGSDCLAANPACPATPASVASVIQGSGIGLEAAQLHLTLVADGATYACGTLSQCLTDQTQWPPTGHNTPGLSITLSAVYSFHSVLSALWPGQGSVSVNYSAEATDVIQF